MTGSVWIEHVLDGHFTPDQAGQYHLLPFDVPANVKRLEIEYSYDSAISADPGVVDGNSLDIGLFDQRGATYPGPGFRGWSGSARQAFFLSASAATPGYMPGPIEPGTWHILLGFYKSAPTGCRFKVNIRMLQGESGTKGQTVPLLTLESRATQRLHRRRDGWYRGDLHCHSHHSDGDSAPEQLIQAAQDLGFDFLSITDHNTLSHLAAQATLDTGSLVLIPGFEVTTYKGHWNVWGTGEWIDFRTTTAEAMQRSIDRAVALGYLVSCNHPRQMGPPWEFPELTGQHCIEVWNGPWQVFNTESLAYWESRLRNGERLAAVGGSDAHFLTSPHIARLGTPTTWIHCSGLPTAPNLLAHLKAGHAFISDSPQGPRLIIRSASGGMGDVVKCPASGQLPIVVETIGGNGLHLEIVGADGVLASTILGADVQTCEFIIPVTHTPFVRAQLRGTGAMASNLRALTNPIYLE